MSAKSPEGLWTRLCSALSEKGLLAPGHPTPGEIARHADGLRGGDDIARFVNAYYYPRLYGAGEGALSDADAEAIVAHLERKRQEPRRQPPPAAATAAATLQSLVDAAALGQEVPIPRGIYRETVRIDKPVILVGTGAVGDVILEGQAAPALILQSAATIQRVTIKTAGQPAAVTPAVSVTRGRAIMEDCVIETSAAFDGIWIEAGAEPTLHRVRVEGGGQVGIRVARSAGGSFDECRIAGMTAGAISALGNPRFSRCEFAHNKNDAVTLEQGAAVFESCRFHDNDGTAVYADDGANPTLRECRLHDNSGAGVLGARGAQIILDRCEIRANRASGVEAADGVTIKANRCRIFANDNVGVLFDTGTSGLVNDCAVHDNTSSGIEVRQGARVTVKRTDLWANGDYGLIVKKGAVCTVEQGSAARNKTGNVRFEDDEA